MKTYAVKLRLYRGKKSHDEKGNVESANQFMDAPTYLSFEWENFMKNASLVGYSDAKVVSVSEIVYETLPVKDGKKDDTYIKTSYKKVDIDSEIANEIKAVVKDAFKTQTSEKSLTEDQKRIATLEAQIASLANSSKDKPKVKKEGKGFDDTPDTNEELEVARDKYTEVFGKKPNHLKKLQTLNEEIEAELNK